MKPRETKWSKPFKSKIATEPEPVATPEPKKVPVATPTPAPAPAPTPASELPWKSFEHLTNSLNRASEGTLKEYAHILGIEYDSNFLAFKQRAKDKYDAIRSE